MISEVRLYNYCKYNPETCRDGGGYGFTEVYRYIGENQWEVEYSTTSEFSYCSYCGHFYDPDEKCGCGEEVRYTESERVAMDILSYQKANQKGKELYISWVEDDIDNKPEYWMPTFADEEIESLVEKVLKQ